MSITATKKLNVFLLLLVATFMFTLNARAQKTIDFEEFAEGTIVSTVDVDGFMVDIFGINPACGEATNAAVIFDSSCPGGICSGQDPDLGTPNMVFGGPGSGVGGMAGDFVNNTALGKLLIVHEHCAELIDPVADPDDRDGPTDVIVTFEAPVKFCSYTIVDQEANEDENVEFFDELDGSLGTTTTPTTGNNGVAVVPASDVTVDGCLEGVKKIVFDRSGSRGLDNLNFFIPGGGCTFTQGGYKNIKNHLDRWPDSISPHDDFPYGGGTYLEVLNTPVKGDPWYILAHQYIAANNNVLNGADDTDIAGKLAEAEGLLAVGPGGVDDADKGDYTGLAGMLDDYNNGIIGPGHCDDVEEEEEEGEQLVAKEQKVKKNDLGTSDQSLRVGLSEIPVAFALDGAYPNPFNPQTTIAFSLPETARVRLAVYDVLGREVAVLVDDVLSAGHHTALFEANNLATGTYIYNLATPKGTFSKTMVLMK